jgi:EAL domain-containing protein (putative c-di-GMP-specific phosphodiesterase class I)
VLVAALGDDLTAVDVVQLLVRFAGRVHAQLIATGVRDAGQQHLLARNGVELFCGEAFARADTRLPQVTFAE